MTDWYDGPRRGVAMVNGYPHLYESCWSNIETEDAVGQIPSFFNAEVSPGGRSGVAIQQIKMLGRLTTTGCDVKPMLG